MEIAKLKGKPSNTPKSDSSGNKEDMENPDFSLVIAAPPNAVNHKKLISDGVNSTYIINSRMVLPFDTLAIKTPTNGDQAIHQAQ